MIDSLLKKYIGRDACLAEHSSIIDYNYSDKISAIDINNEDLPYFLDHTNDLNIINLHKNLNGKIIFFKYPYTCDNFSGVFRIHIFCNICEFSIKSGAHYRHFIKNIMHDGKGCSEIIMMEALE